MTDYRQELLISLSSARELAQQTIRKAQRQYKVQYDKMSREPAYKLGEWVLVRFPQEETGRNRKLSSPWHGPYRITDRRDPDITVTKVYFPSEGVHQIRVCRCYVNFPAGYYWYGGRRKRPGRPPKWVDRLLSSDGDSGSCATSGEEQTNAHSRNLTDRTHDMDTHADKLAHSTFHPEVLEDTVESGVGIPDVVASQTKKVFQGTPYSIATQQNLRVLWLSQMERDAKIESRTIPEMSRRHQDTAAAAKKYPPGPSTLHVTK